MCKAETKQAIGNVQLDDNKSKVEKYLLPILRDFPEAGLELLTTKKASLEFLHLRLPLLIKCSGGGREECKKEIIVDNSTVYRYYIEPYDINGTKYHICSQWWSGCGNNSKVMLELLKELKN